MCLGGALVSVCLSTRVELRRALTVEDTVRNQSTGVDGLSIFLCQRLAATALQVRWRPNVANQLAHVDALDVPSVVLIVVCQLVVQQHRRLERIRDVEVDFARRAVGCISIGHKSPRRRRKWILCHALASQRGSAAFTLISPLPHLTHHCLVVVLARGDVGEISSLQLAVGVVDGEFADLRGKVVEHRANGGKHEPDEKECRQDRLWCQNWLPRLEPLLLECRV